MYVRCIKSVVMDSDSGEDAGKEAFIAGKVYEAFEVGCGDTSIFIRDTELGYMDSGHYIKSTVIPGFFEKHFVIVDGKNDPYSDYDRAMRGI